MPPTQYRPSRRNWVKLWVNEWLTGTVRWQLTQSQRSMWADLLALAGYSRYPGIVCAGETNGKLNGYPIDYLCSLFRCTIPEATEAIELFQQQGRISVEEDGVIKIVNWEKYQSEYQQKRQRTVYKRTQKSTKSPQNLPQMSAQNSTVVESEGEVEGDVEEEKREKHLSPTKGVGGELGSPQFHEFWQAYPRKVDKQETLKSWVKGLCDGKHGEILAGLERWKTTGQWSDPEMVPYPSTWLNKRRWKDEPQKGTKLSAAESKARKTDEAAERVRQRLNSQASNEAQ